MTTVATSDERIMNDPTTSTTTGTSTSSSSSSSSSASSTFRRLVLQDLQLNLTRGTALDDRNAIAMPVAAMNALLKVVERSEANTMMGLQNELKNASDVILNEWNNNDDHDNHNDNDNNNDNNGNDTTTKTSTKVWHNHHRSNISLASGCALFLRYSTRTFLELPGDFSTCRDAILERGQRFAGISLMARDRIATMGHDFVGDGVVVLTHGWSRVVAALLLKAAETKHFSVYILEGRPDATGAKAAQYYDAAGIPTRIVLDAAMGYVMEQVDLVIVGAEGVVENGGIVNKLGTNALATVARAQNKPFYVAAESYKFARAYPLNQNDLPSNKSVSLQFVASTSTTATTTTTTTTTNKTATATNDDTTASNKDENHHHHHHHHDGMAEIIKVPPTVQVDHPLSDYTPAKYITLLFTDLGVLTPSAVSDELIRLYQ